MKANRHFSFDFCRFHRTRKIVKAYGGVIFGWEIPTVPNPGSWGTSKFCFASTIARSAIATNWSSPIFVPTWNRINFKNVKSFSSPSNVKFQATHHEWRVSYDPDQRCWKWAAFSKFVNLGHYLLSLSCTAWSEPGPYLSLSLLSKSFSYLAKFQKFTLGWRTVGCIGR